MDVSVIGAATDALIILMDPFRLMMLSAGVLMGLFLGIVPGIGGLVGMALLLPFTYTMDSYAAFAMLLGMSAVTGTSDTIPAVLFGVPGSAGAQATVMDGNPMAKRGEAGRALAAAYTASLIGGLVGAFLLALTIPVLRPIMLYMASPQLLAFTFLGISMVAILSGKAPMRGLIAAGVGILLSMVGADPTIGTQRWTMGTYYLWEGVPLVPMILGLFALPEVADLLIKRQAVSSDQKFDTRTGMWLGFKDAIKHKWLVLRGGALGAGVGAVPGLGASVVDWIAYGFALQTEKDAHKTFGKGDVRGVIAPESANNAITAGSLVPTIAFGVPGGATMAVLLSVFLIHGLVPGPDMLTKNLSLTYSMVWSIAIANILGAGLCFAFSGQLAKIALLRYTLILPGVMVFVYIGAFQSSRSWGDIYTLLVFAVIGYAMKQMKWPRPPLILGFVLGALVERYMFISFSRYGWGWMADPIVAVVLMGSFSLMLMPIYKHYKAMGGVRGIMSNMSAPQFRASDLMHVFMLAIAVYCVATALNWPWGAQIGPIIIGIGTIVVGSLALLNQTFSRTIIARREAAGEDLMAHAVHMDAADDRGGMSLASFNGRAVLFLGYFVFFLIATAVFGFLPAIPMFVALLMRVEGRERWTLVIGQSVVMVLLMYVIFDRLLRLPWPGSLIGDWFPVLSVIPSV